MKQLYNIVDYGAVAHSEELQTAKIQAAIDAAFLAGGGEVVVPRGVFKTATIRLRSNITLHLLEGAVLDGSKDPADYTHFLDDKIEPINPENELDEEYGTGNFVIKHWYDAIIKVYKAKNVKIIGEKDSVINGNNVYNPNGEEGYRGPHAIQMTYCKNLEFCGYTIVDSANWAHTLFKCENIFAHDLKVLGGHDGFHTRICRNILIEDCEFRTGDDCIAGFANENVVVRNCYLDCACSAFRFGGTDILIDHCRTHGPATYGFRGSLSKEEKAASAPTNENHRHEMHTPFLYFCDNPARVSKPQGNIVIQNCVFERPNSFFRLRWGQRWVTNRCLVDITFRNCKCTDVALPIDLYCDFHEPCTLRMEDVEISAREGYEDQPIMHADMFSKIDFENVTFTGYNDPTILVKNPDQKLFDRWGWRVSRPYYEVDMKHSTPVKIEYADELKDQYTVV